ncbi:MAG: hypothetical protein L0241_22800 [Planctomycetia bacterium]|nr:hypothetical protein [Planctomycetia bacterium]
MSASAPVAVPPTQSRLTPARLLLAVLFAIVGVVAVWQGFGAVGYGTDAHALRVIVAVAALFVCGLILVWPRMKLPVRVIAVLLGVGGAVAAWWLVPSRDNGWSLREAVAERDKVKSLTATPLLDDIENGGWRAKASLAALEQQYPTLAGDLRADYTRWVGSAEQTLVERYRMTPREDLKTALELQPLRTAIGDLAGHPTDTPVEVAARQWLSNAVHAKTDELRKIPFREWEQFDHTAPERKALAEAFPQTQDTLIRAEAEWVDSSVELIVSHKLTPKPGETPPTRDDWLKALDEVLKLQSLDGSDRRFAKARQRLFVVAHQTAQRDITAHLVAGRYEVAGSIARTHQLQWDATAALFGESELKKLADLRKQCETLAKLASVAVSAEPPEIAPPPRTKPDGE